ncbi:glucosaminidase domain-containing protein [Magnetovibrio sp. PR-2]|uniref:glucosaminidase domain-containing protein n=1 Tax=Magnetovibrio sp. PR-2 TaxID=3120356 RepID=UPI002FCE577E
MKNTVWSSLSAASVLGAALYATAAWMPEPTGTAAVSATFADPEAGVAQGLEMEISVATVPEVLNDMDTAAGPLPKGPDYDLDEVLAGQREVPRITQAALPKNLSAVRETNARKQIFFKTVLPLVLQVNEQIEAERGRLWELQSQIMRGKELDALDRLWLAVLAEQYGTRRGDIVAILERHDVVPPSLALAQAATESAWGTSRFVREGNAMFGEWTFKSDHKGIVPNGRENGKTHRVRAFDTLQDSVRSYVANLNKHRAYKEFRAERTHMRAQGRVVDGMELAGTLHRYSERGAAYVAELRAIISTNDLDLLDNAQLTSNGTLEPII